MSGCAAGPPQQLELTIRRGEGSVEQSFKLAPGGVVRIGRRACSDIVLDFEGVSAHHADILLQAAEGGSSGQAGPRLCIRDDSRNGTGVRPGPEASDRQSASAAPAWEAVPKGSLRTLDHGWQLKVPLKSRHGKAQLPELERTLTLHIASKGGAGVPNGKAAGRHLGGTEEEESVAAAAPVPVASGHAHGIPAAAPQPVPSQPDATVSQGADCASLPEPRQDSPAGTGVAAPIRRGSAPEEEPQAHTASRSGQAGVDVPRASSGQEPRDASVTHAASAREVGSEASVFEVKKTPSLPSVAAAAPPPAELKGGAAANGAVLVESPAREAGPRAEGIGGTCIAEAEKAGAGEAPGREAEVVAKIESAVATAERQPWRPKLRARLALAPSAP